MIARDDLTRAHWRGAVNRSYYTIFHAASAVLLWLDIERSRHSGTQAAFGEFLVKRGNIEPKFGRIYTRARKAREEQDYDLDVAPPTEQDAKQIVDDAERFVSRMKRFLREEGAIPKTDTNKIA